MAKKLVDYIRLWSVEWFTMMSDVLGRVEYSEGQSIQELSLGQQPANRPESPTSLFFQEVADFLQLRDLFFSEPDMFLKLIDCPIELLACISFEKTH